MNDMCHAGAKLIDGKVLARIEVHGKNLFYFFGEGADQVVMHIHFGMSGRFRVSPLPGPETTPTTRLQLINDSQGIVANLSAMTVQHGDLGAFPLSLSLLESGYTSSSQLKSPFLCLCIALAG